MLNNFSCNNLVDNIIVHESSYLGFLLIWPIYFVVLKIEEVLFSCFKKRKIQKNILYRLYFYAKIL